MRRSVFRAVAFVRTFWGDQSGVSAAIFALCIIPIVGITGFAIDVGHVVLVKNQLQASADAAAVAGADALTTGANPLAAASTYSATSGNKNAIANLPVTMVTGYPQLKCFGSTGVTCVGTPAANGIVVQQQTTVPTFFAQVLGISSINVTATATAGAGGGQAVPLNVALVLDTTASMNGADANCSINGATRIICALAGARTLVGTLSPSVDQAGVFTFPGLQAGQAQYDYDCSSNPQPKIAAYNASPNYQIVPASTDYRTQGSQTLNTGSDLVLAIQGGGSGCGQGMSAIGGVGTFYADAIRAAQASLLLPHPAGQQNVLIILSDGDANAIPGNMPNGEASNQCHEAIAAAQAAASAGTWVYSIAYGASTSATGSCSTDTPHISACSTMEGMASDPTKFFSDASGSTGGGGGGCTSNANPVSELVAIFNTISQSLQQPRLLPDNTT